MSKNEQIQFFDSHSHFLKHFCNYGGIYSEFRKKFKKDSGEINPLEGVSLKLVVKVQGGNQQYVCLLFF